MICPKCGANNIDGSSFCIKCGVNLKEVSVEPTPTVENVEVPVNEASSVTPAPSTVETPQPTVAPKNKVSLNYFMYLIASFIKPHKCYSEEKEKLADTKVSIILTVITSIFMAIVSLLRSIYYTVRTETYDINKGYINVWDWDKLKYFSWFKEIFKTYLICAGFILLIAFVFFIASLIIKKDLKFPKSLSIACTSVIPLIVLALILQPIFYALWSHLGPLFRYAGEIYLITNLIALYNEELKLEGDTKVYYFLTCIALLGYITFEIYFFV